MSAPTRDPMLDAIDCPSCGKDFLPKRAGQQTCSPKCAGAQGAAKRNYRKPTQAQRPRIVGGRKR